MKELLVLLLYINYVICVEENVGRMTIYSKKFPKKVDRQVQILNSRKNSNLIKFDPFRIKETPKKRYGNNKGYTFFPAIVENVKILRSVPDSPYFPMGEVFENNHRVKKFSPDFMLNKTRFKRDLQERRNSKGNQKAAVNANKQDKDKKTKNVKRMRYTVKAPAKKNKDIRSANSTLKLHFRNKGDKPVRDHNKNRHRKKREGHPRSERAERRLIAARDAIIEDYPYMVSIQKGNEHWCSGALLNPRIVITTANCIWKSDRVSRMRVRAGSRFADHGGQLVGIQEAMKHPDWSLRRNPDFDVAMLLLDRNIRFTDKVHGVDLPNRVMMPAFDDAWITSFGAERRDGLYDNGKSLQVYHARLLDHEKCNNVTTRFGVVVTDNFICFAQTGRRAPCTRDTGAPAVSDGVVWGLASWGIRKLCGTERFPAMFSYLASPSNMDFIMNATKVLMADERFYPYADRLPPSQIV